MVECRTVGQGDQVEVHLLPGNFIHPTLPVSFGSVMKSCWFLLSDVYAKGSKRSHTGGKCVSCCGLHLS